DPPADPPAPPPAATAPEAPPPAPSPPTPPPATAPPPAPPPPAPPPAAPSTAPSAAPAAAPPKAVMDHVPRFVGISAGWAWNTVNKLPVREDGKKTQPHGLSIFTDFLWQVGGLGGGWPSWLGFLAGFLYFPGASPQRDAFVLEYGILVRHGLFPGFVLRPFVAYGLGATQAWVSDVGSRGIGHLTRLSLGTDIVLRPSVALGLELSYKII